MGRQSIKVRHNMEMAHRLYLLQGKCEQIHGHSWWAELELIGEVDDNGIILPFGEVKQVFRHHLDTTFDHHLLLNIDDPVVEYSLPGAVTCSGDPTTENVSKWIGEWAEKEFNGYADIVRCTVWETSVNCAVWSNA